MQPKLPSGLAYASWEELQVLGKHTHYIGPVHPEQYSNPYHRILPKWLLRSKKIANEPAKNTLWLRRSSPGPSCCADAHDIVIYPISSQMWPRAERMSRVDRSAYAICGLAEATPLQVEKRWKKEGFRSWAFLPPDNPVTKTVGILPFIYNGPA